MDQALNQKIDAYIAENKEQLLQDIAALVAIDSVEGTPEEGAPFGAGPRAALDKTLELAAGMGFATRNCENYIGYAELAGADPEKYLATICHVDVVPVGNGWTADPFKMRIQDGWLLGRGVSDDKGPMIVTLYALKFLKEQGYQLRYPIRAIVGDNEETNMKDVEYYLANYLLDNGLCNDAERAYLEAIRKLHASTAGEGLGINCADGPFGPLTVIGGRIYMQDGRIYQTMDSRFPTCTNGETMEKQIRAALGDGAELQDVTAAEPFYIEADSPAIQACINTYNEVTGENAKPFTMGGGTYARHFPYAVSFGPEHVDLPLPEFGGPMHGANEAAPIDKLLEAVKIYIIALLRLEEIDF